jgi:hypothetical protein
MQRLRRMLHRLSSQGRFAGQLPKVGPFLAGFLSVENRASNRKAREELGWEVRGKGILEDIENGSYVEVARALKDGRDA